MWLTKNINAKEGIRWYWVLPPILFSFGSIILLYTPAIPIFGALLKSNEYSGITGYLYNLIVHAQKSEGLLSAEQKLVLFYNILLLSLILSAVCLWIVHRHVHIKIGRYLLYLTVLTQFLLLPINYGTLIIPNTYPEVQITSKDEIAQKLDISKDDTYWLLSEPGKNIVIYPKKSKSNTGEASKVKQIKILTLDNIVKMAVIGHSNIFQRQLSDKGE
jgi:hypothetical protein